MQYDVIVVGGGAAGFFCARTAGRRGRRVLVLEHQARFGNKVLISGGGRCNFTNLGATAAQYVTHGSPHFLKSALARFTPQDFLALVEDHGIAWHEKKLGQLFCDRSSRQILDLLTREAAAAGVEARAGCAVLEVTRHRSPASSAEGTDAETDCGTGTEATAGWTVTTAQGAFTSASLVIATGGLSFPQLGATAFGYRIAGQFGLRVVPPRPGLVPLTWNPADLEAFGPLSGITIDCETRHPGCPTAFRENLLFTHRGISGPAALQVSNYWQSGDGIEVNLLPGRSALEILNAQRQGSRDLRGALRSLLPERFLDAWSRRHAPSRPLAQWSRKDLESVAALLHAWRIVPAGDEGYAKAEVTLGGVETQELSSKTLECRRIPGLFFVGEIVDVTGWLGGYNFQWAWASGHAAGLAA